MDTKLYTIEFSKVTKEYAMVKTLKEKLLVFFTKAKKVSHFTALNNVSFKIKKGEVVGLIGLNGSGKSTIANLMIEATAPTTGNITVNGHIELIAIGVGLNNELTGMENIYQKCYMMGMSKKQILDVIDDIIEFSELGEFIHQPIKKYSSGMRSRLGFSISIQANPDILIIDEALSVGDKAFADKCLIRIRELILSDKTVIFVSHSNAQIKQFCDHVIWLDKGKVIADSDDLNGVLTAYDQFVQKKKKNIDAVPIYNGKNLLDTIEYTVTDEKEDIDIVVTENISKEKNTLLQKINTILGFTIILLLGVMAFFIGLGLALFIIFN